MARPLYLRLGSSDDDFVPTFLDAAARNFIDAGKLRRSNRRLAAIYLYGYSVEMTVKAAYFREVFRGGSMPLNLARITAALRAQEVNAWNAIQAPRRPGPHDIEGWAQLLVRKRVSRNNAHPAALATELINRAANVYLNWREYMRYRSPAVSSAELRDAWRDAAWFRRNAPLL